MLGKRIKLLTNKYARYGANINSIHLVIAEDPTELVIYSKSIKAHDGSSANAIEFLKGYEKPSNRGENCLYISPRDVELIEDFKHIFNGLGKQHE